MGDDVEPSVTFRDPKQGQKKTFGGFTVASSHVTYIENGFQRNMTTELFSGPHGFL